MRRIVISALVLAMVAAAAFLVIRRFGVQKVRGVVQNEIGRAHV